MSQTAQDANMALATRTIPLGEYCMTGGAALPIASKKAALEALSRIGSKRPKLLEGPAGMALLIVRACLAAGAADHVEYASATEKPKEPGRRPSRLPPPRRRWR